MKRLREWIDHQLFSTGSVIGMVVCRIVFGSILLLSYLRTLPHVPTIFGPQGIAGHQLRSRAPAAWPQGFALNETFQWLYQIENMETIWLLYGLLLLSSALFALGAFTRVSGGVALLLHAVFQAHASTLVLGWGEMIKPFMLYVVLSNAGDFWSIDAWRKRRNAVAPAPVPVEGVRWPQLLLRIHLCTMYATASWPRLVSPSWLAGDMVLAALGDGWYSRFPLDWFAYRDVLRLATYGAFLLEPIAPFCLLIPRLAPWCALALIGMHVTLEILTDVGWWQYMMIAALTTVLPLDRWLLLRDRV